MAEGATIFANPKRAIKPVLSTRKRESLFCVMNHKLLHHALHKVAGTDRTLEGLVGTGVSVVEAAQLYPVLHQS